MKKITYVGLLAALTYICTTYIQIPLPNKGYVNAGSIVIVVTACLFGPLSGAIAGVIGSVIADLFVAPIWIPATIVVKLCLGFFVCVGVKRREFAMPLYIVTGFIVVGGYYIADAVFYGNCGVPVFNSVPALML